MAGPGAQAVASEPLNMTHESVRELADASAIVLKIVTKGPASGPWSR